MNTNFESISDLKSALISDTGLQTAFKNDPVEAINKIQDTPLYTDKWIYRIVVIALGISIVFIIIGVLILIGFDRLKDDKTVPTILTAIGSGAIGALAGLLAPQPKAVKN